MNGSQMCVLAYAVGLAMILGYAGWLWIAHFRARRRVSRPVGPGQIVITARVPVPSRAP